MLGYEFVSLTEEQIETRRELLDKAGYQANLAPILILTTIYIFRKANLTRSHKDGTPPSSLTLFLRRVSWILGNTYIDEFGPLQVQLFGFVYTAFLLFRIIYQTGNDYMHVTKAFGHVAVSQLPLHYLLAIKSPVSPITWATGLAHERLNAYHRLFGRIVHALLATHAILYLRFFILMDLLPKRIKDTDVRLGIMAFWTVNFIGILSTPPIRARFYHKVFYRSHVILSALLLIILWFHVSYTRVYVGQAAVALVLNAFMRKRASQPATVISLVKTHDKLQITLETTRKHLQYHRGMHVYLNKAGLGPRTPFTVLDSRVTTRGVSEVDLVAKISGGPMTGWLDKMSGMGARLNLQLEGPYGKPQMYTPGPLPERHQKKRQKVLLVAGGVGATYALSIFKSLVSSMPSAEDIKFVWVVKTVQDLAWAKDFLESEFFCPHIEINITKHTASDKEDPILGTAKSNGLIVNTKRPDFNVVVDSFVTLKAESDTSTEKERLKLVRDSDPVVVMVCGPASLSKSLRRAVERHVMKYGREIVWWEEQFGFGGSLA